MRPASPIALVRAHLEAEDRHDVEGIMATFSEACVYRVPAYGVDLAGKEPIARYYAAMFDAFPDFVNREVACHAAERAVFAEVVTERTHARTWQGIAPTSRHLRTSALAQFPIAGDGLLGGEIVYVDAGDVLRQMGVLPEGDLAALARRFEGPLAGKVALVTGASGGIGGALAKALARAGAAVVASGRDQGALEKLAVELDAPGLHVELERADLAVPGAAGTLVAKVLERLGHVDVLVNAAGTISRGPALEVSETSWDQVQDVNLKAAFFTCQAAGRSMLQRGEGAIVNISSLNGVVGNRRAVGYAASKGGLVQMTKSLALEWAPHGVRVNAIAPGFLRTDMTAPLFSDPEITRGILEHIPAGRLGTPDDLAGAVVYLASDAAAYVTGQVLYVDGGYLCV